MPEGLIMFAGTGLGKTVFGLAAGVTLAGLAYFAWFAWNCWPMTRQNFPWMYKE